MLNEEQYKELCHICDRILLASDSNNERIAISWLHIIREHPVFLKKYKDIYDSTNLIIQKIKIHIRLIYYKISWAFFTLRLNQNKKKWHSSNNKLREIDFLFVSHILNESFFGKEDDFYFSDIPIKIQEKGLNVAIICFNHTDKSSKEVAIKWADNSIERIIISNSINYNEEMVIRNKLQKESKKIRKWANNEKCLISKRIYKRASIEALSLSTQKNLRFSTQIEDVIRLYEPKVLVVTFEGHAWERIAFAAAHKVNKKIKCVGFQHSAIFRLQHAIKRSLKVESDPDYILTSGQASKQQLINSSYYNTIPVEILGSNRGGVNGVINAKKDSNNFCLVLPEGDMSECNLLFRYSIESANLLPEITFVWRLHPLISFKILLKQNTAFKKLPKNIILSELSLDEDIKRCSIALYRGTTAIMRAICGGIVPIYLELNGEMSINPLHAIDQLIPKVSTPDDFQKLISKIKDDKLLSEMEKIIDYCQSYYLPFNHNKLLDVYYRRDFSIMSQIRI